jgi:hypothetical protein
MLYQKIFIASADDVNGERSVVRVVANRIRRATIFQNRIDLDIVAWGFPEAGLPLTANMMPNEAIACGLPKPSECDIVVVILAEHIGMQLSADYVKPNGSPYASITEWEFLDAVEAARHGDGPAVWVYRRSYLPMLDAEDPKFSQQLEQWKKQDIFLRNLENVFGTKRNHFRAFESSEQFQQQLEQHLHNHLLLKLACHNGQDEITIGSQH